MLIFCTAHDSFRWVVFIPIYLLYKYHFNPSFKYKGGETNVAKKEKPKQVSSPAGEDDVTCCPATTKKGGGGCAKLWAAVDCFQLAMTLELLIDNNKCN
ncbi:hypothetical protein ES332_D10G229300v1 [Gossypium tomentosum]|uniref:Uncharacterized protein n=1 Tax=Gossypium tomentosum TaxID=34277 RepID=A0A5D2J9S7_GOSTO|nr:hypothetical protein ES332_D10G229300v1 [Gossypium tomentosum]